MSHVDKKEALRAFFITGYPDIDMTELSNAIYAMSELGLWPDNVDSVSINQVLKCWTIVEKLIRTSFPHDLNV